MEITDAHKSLVNNLAPIHGSFRLASERSGVVAYMACPHCLEVKGKAEFESKHMVILLDRWLKNTFNSSVGKCMRCDAKFTKNQLLGFPTLKERNYSDNNKNMVRSYVPKPIHYKEVVEGVSVPYDAGVTIPLTELPKDHPAWQYLLSRQTLDLECLVRDFHPAFCVQERPTNKDIGLFYKKLPESRDTPQGRIVFHSYIKGKLSAWQSRLIEKTELVGGGKMKSYLHPDTFQFINTHFEYDGKITFVPPYAAKKNLPCKYYNGRFHKHNIVFGYDAYAQHNSNIPYADRTIFVAEGILDAVQLGGYAVACLGKQLHAEQVSVLLSLAPKIVFLVQDDDAAESGFRANKELMEKYNLPVFRVSPPEGYNDFGDVDHTLVKTYVQSIHNYR